MIFPFRVSPGLTFVSADLDSTGLRLWCDRFAGRVVLVFAASHVEFPPSGINRSDSSSGLLFAVRSARTAPSRIPNSRSYL